ncbi:hypothetical protein MKW92_035258 [Papaver armeniacum]|nr:hypothetical protein MKW92_035258 [Papaver armeniacum]
MMDNSDDSHDDLMDSDQNEVNLAAIMKKLKSREEDKDALVYGSLLGLQDGSTSAPPLDDIHDDLQDSDQNDSHDDMDSDQNEVNLAAAIMKKLKGRNVKCSGRHLVEFRVYDNPVYFLMDDSHSPEEVKDALRRMSKIRSLLGLQDGSTSDPPLDDIRMPESALRGDDVSYEKTKASVEKMIWIT